MGQNESVAGIATRSDGKILVMHRLPGGSVGSLWEFPGGKVEPGESHEDALIREWEEETGFSISVGKKMASGRFYHRDELFALTAYRVVLPESSGSPDLREHDDYRWVDLRELADLDLVDSDRIIAQNLDL